MKSKSDISIDANNSKVDIKDAKDIVSAMDIENNCSDYSMRLIPALAWLENEGRRESEKARTIIETMLPDALLCGDLYGIAWLTYYFAWCFIDFDNYDEGIKEIESAHLLFLKIESNEGVTRCHNALGLVYTNLGIFDLALDHFREAIKILKLVDMKGFIGTVYMNMTDCLYELGETVEALETFKRCLKEGVIERNRVVFHRTGGLIYHSLGQTENAEKEFEKALELSKGWPLMELTIKLAMSNLYFETGRKHYALQLVNEGVEISRNIKDRYSCANFCLARANISLSDGLCYQAISDVEEAIAIAKEIGMKKIEADAEKLLYKAWRDLNENIKALDALIRHYNLMETIKSQQTVRRIYALHEERSRIEAKHFEDMYRQISLISDIGQRITSNLDLDKILSEMPKAINELLEAPTILIGIVNYPEKTLDYHLMIIRGVKRDLVRLSLTEPTFGGWCINNASAILIGNVKSEYQNYVRSYEDFPYEGEPEQSLVFVPLMIGNTVKGVISVQSPRSSAYDKKSIETLRAIGAFIAIAIENSGLFKQIVQLATNDGLTGLLNRRVVSEALTDQYLLVKRSKSPIGVIMIDIDHFKNVNDSYGHDKGDEVICMIASILFLPPQKAKKMLSLNVTR